MLEGCSLDTTVAFVTEDGAICSSEKPTQAQLDTAGEITYGCMSPTPCLGSTPAPMVNGAPGK